MDSFTYYKTFYENHFLITKERCYSTSPLMQSEEDCIPKGIKIKCIKITRDTHNIYAVCLYNLREYVIEVSKLKEIY